MIEYLSIVHVVHRCVLCSALTIKCQNANVPNQDGERGEY